jgi:PAS domain S-box-containing protein
MINGVDGVVTDCNKAAGDLFGTTADKLVGRALIDAHRTFVREDTSPLLGGDGPIMQTLRTGEACSDVIVGLDHPGRLRRWLSVNTCPITDDGNVMGVVSIFTDISRRLITERGLAMLAEVTQILKFPPDGEDPLQILCDVLVAHGHHALVWIGSPNINEQRNVDIAYAAGVTDYLQGEMYSWSGATRLGLGPVGTALRTGNSETCNEIANDSLSEPWQERAAQFGLSSCISIPFTPAGRRAVLNLYARHPFAFDETTVHFLEEIVNEVEFGISRLAMERKLSSAVGGTIDALARMTEIRDPYTEGRQAHVGSLGAAIARHMKLDTSMVELIGQSGKVYDVGMSSVPTEVLTRPGRLSAEEFELVKQNPGVGADILTRAALPWPISEVALQHSERMDGSGYPKGLPGNEIILPARIIAVAARVVAMTHARRYRPALDVDRALAEFSAGAGTLFDPDVVKACLAVFENGFTFESDTDTLEE